MGFVECLGWFVLSAFWLAWLAVRLRGGDRRRVFVEAWLSQSGLTVLRCRPWGFVPLRDDVRWIRYVYRVTAIDEQRQLRTGWVSVDGKFLRREFAPKQAKVRWVCVRERPRPFAPPASMVSARGPLWDQWIDG